MTFLDYEELERKGADIASQLEEKDRMIQNMMRKQEQFEQMIQSLIDSGQLKPDITSPVSTRLRQTNINQA